MSWLVALVLFLASVLALDVAALLWGADTRDGLTSPEWDRRWRWYESQQLHRDGGATVPAAGRTSMRAAHTWSGFEPAVSPRITPRATSATPPMRSGDSVPVPSMVSLMSELTGTGPPKAYVHKREGLIWDRSLTVFGID
ncbi:MAG TPA: hypothetical protein VF221_17455 [Chloroflexota bacterium]